MPLLILLWKDEDEQFSLCRQAALFNYHSMSPAPADQELFIGPYFTGPGKAADHSKDPQRWL